MSKGIEKNEIQVVSEKEFKAIFVPNVHFCSDTFLCADCGARGIYKVYGNTKTCPECGGTMYRQ